MQINLTLFATGATVIANNLRVTAAQESTPSAVVDTYTSPPPQSFPLNVTLDVPNPVVHRVRVYSSPDASPGTLLAEFIYDPTYQNLEIKLPQEIQVGSGGPYDPGDGSNSIDLTDFAAYDWYPMRRIAGGMMSVTEYTKSTDNKTLNLVGADQFADGEYVWIFFNPKVTTAVPTIIQSALYRGVKIITVDTALDSTYSGNAISVVGPLSGAITLTLPVLTGVSDFSPFDIDSYEWSNYQFTIQVTGTDRIRYKGQDFSKIFLGSCEFCRLVKFPTTTGYPTGYWKVVSMSDGMTRVGRYINVQLKSTVDTPQPDFMWADGSSIVAANWPRIAWYCSLLQPGQFIPIGVRTNDFVKSMWAYSAEATPVTIYLPDTRGLFMRGLPGTRGNDVGGTSADLAGRYEQDTVGQFTLSFQIPRGDSYNGNPYDSVHVGRGQDSNVRSPLTINTPVNVGLETRGKNVGLYLGVYS